MKILFITAQTPYGKGETFILEELLEAKKQKVDFVIIPRNPPKEIFHREGEKLKDNVIWLPIMNLRMLFYILIYLIVKPSLWKVLKAIILNSRNLSILLKNLFVLPKSIYISEIVKKISIDHIHVHWGSTTATMGYMISLLTGIPWSFTSHRWDIYENNMLKEKVKSAFFVRCISEKGKNDLLDIIGKELDYKVKIIHMGVKIPELEIFLGKSDKKDKDKFFTIATPANLLPVKGHRYLVEACEILIRKGINNFKCMFYGDGPSKEDLSRLIKSKNLSNYIEIKGVIRHNNLIDLYKEGKIDLVVLPSIITPKGEHEGIPVALMEAMAYSIPVISTNTGSIPELVEGAGIVVPEKDPIALANAIEKCIIDREYAHKLGLLGRKKVIQEFNTEENIKKLIGEMKKSRK